MSRPDTLQPDTDAPASALVRLKPVAQFAVDALVAALALALAMAVRYEFAVPPAYARMAWGLLPGVMLIAPAVNWALGSYRQMWMYTSLRESRVLAVSAAVLAVALTTLRLAGVSFGDSPGGPIVVPYSIAMLVPTFFAVGAIGVRMLRRWQVFGTTRRPVGEAAMRTIVVGAGRTASALLIDAQAQGTISSFVGLLDDAPSKQGRRLHGVTVLGRTTDLAREVRERDAERVVVAMPSADPAVVRVLIRQAEAAGAVVRVVPGVRASLAGEAPAETSSPTLADLVDAEEIKATLLPHVAEGRDGRVLVTGGAGYIGNFLVRRLLAEGYHVRVLDNLTFGDGALADLRGHPSLELRHGDIANLRDVAGAVRDCATVVALAAIVGDPACGVDAEETLTLNYEATKVLTEACNFYGVSRLVFASSCSVYGASEGDEVLDETSALHPVSLYARTRILSEDIVFSRCGSTVPVVLRLATVFGLSPRMRFDLVVNALTVRGLVDGRFQVFGGDQWRPFVHCADVAEAFFLAATAPDERVAGQVFNVGSDAMNFTIAQASEVVADELRAAGHAVEPQTVASTDDARNYRVTFAKIERTLGFQPRYDLPAGIREMIDAIAGDPSLRDYGHARYSNVAVMRERLGPGLPTPGDGAAGVAVPMPGVGTRA